jgi:hypothetical protein
MIPSISAAPYCCSLSRPINVIIAVALQKRRPPVPEVNSQTQVSLIAPAERVMPIRPPPRVFTALMRSGSVMLVRPRSRVAGVTVLHRQHPDGTVRTVHRGMASGRLPPQALEE